MELTAVIDSKLPGISMFPPSTQYLLNEKLQLGLNPMQSTAYSLTQIKIDV